MSSPVEFVVSVAKSLADAPEQVSAQWVDTDKGGHVALKVSEGDRGRIIGRRGRNIDALRLLLKAAFGADGKEVGVELAE
jgi:uncharacterized protein